MRSSSSSSSSSDRDRKRKDSSSSPSSLPPLPLTPQEEAEAAKRFSAQLNVDDWNEKIMKGKANGANLPLAPLEEEGGKEGGREGGRSSRWRKEKRGGRRE
jgi:hypothetical protein